MGDNKVIQCKECGFDFVWTLEEQVFYEEKGLESPTFCPICRSIYSEARKDGFRGKDSIAEGSTLQQG